MKPAGYKKISAKVTFHSIWHVIQQLNLTSNHPPVIKGLESKAEKTKLRKNDIQQVSFPMMPPLSTILKKKELNETLGSDLTSKRKKLHLLCPEGPAAYGSKANLQKENDPGKK